MTLSHLFTAYFSDGTAFRQTPADVDYGNTTKSAFTELQRAISEGHDLVRFELRGPEHVYALNFTDGTFWIDGHRDLSTVRPPKNAALRLIYFRRNTVHLNQQTERVVHFRRRNETHRLTAPTVSAHEI